MPKNPPLGPGSRRGAGGRPESGRGWVRTLLTVAVVALVMLGARQFAVQNFQIPSGSMEPTLQVGDQIAVDKLSWRYTGLDSGDIVVFDGEGNFDRGTTHKHYVKRIIGLPGDTVACCDRDGRVTVNGTALDEPYVTAPDASPFGPVMVPDGHLFVLGDHRANSDDSRFRGTVPLDHVIGRAFAGIWPLSNIGALR